MSDLLPPNATPQEHALADTLARLSDVPVPLRALWSAQDCPASLLPWLAWALSVDEWDTGWSEQQKRDTIAVAIPTQRIKGTIGAVRTALAAIGIDVRVQEWFNQIPAGSPYTYRLLFDGRHSTVTQEQQRRALDLVNTNKSLRSHLTEIAVTATSESRVIVAAASMVGHEINLTTFKLASLVINQSAFIVE